MGTETKDLSKCECGSEHFLVDTTDTIAVKLDSEGRIQEYSKRYDGDFHNLNCERCGRPAARQPGTLQSMYARRQAGAT